MSEQKEKAKSVKSVVDKGYCFRLFKDLLDVG